MNTQADSHPNNQPTVLIIEDDTLIAHMYQVRFEKDGFQVLLAHDGETGLNLAGTNHPNLIILDLMLPKVSGQVVLETLKKDKALAQIPVIVLTSLAQESEQKQAQALGAQEYLIKHHHSPSQIFAIAQKYLTGKTSS